MQAMQAGHRRSQRDTMKRRREETTRQRQQARTHTHTHRYHKTSRKLSPRVPILTIMQPWAYAPFQFLATKLRLISSLLLVASRFPSLPRGCPPVCLPSFLVVCFLFDCLGICCRLSMPTSTQVQVQYIMGTVGRAKAKSHTR